MYLPSVVDMLTNRLVAFMTLNYFDIRCTEIYLGLGTNTQLLSTLKGVHGEGVDSIKLLYSLPLHPELDQLPFEKMKIEGVFRDTVYQPSYGALNSPTFQAPPELSLS